MHNEVEQFVKSIKKEFPEVFTSDAVLEYGSYDVNGNLRSLFECKNYTGLDWRPGPGVTLVSLMHQYDGPPFDTLISTSACEHDPYWPDSLDKCMEKLKLGGSFIFTCAGPNWESHCEETAPYREGMPNSFYYKGLSADSIKRKILSGNVFGKVVDKSDDIGRDVFLFFYKKKNKGGSYAQEEKKESA